MLVRKNETFTNKNGHVRNENRLSARDQFMLTTYGSSPPGAYSLAFAPTGTSLDSQAQDANNRVLKLCRELGIKLEEATDDEDVVYAYRIAYNASPILLSYKFELTFPPGRWAGKTLKGILDICVGGHINMNLTREPVFTFKNLYFSGPFLQFTTHIKNFLGYRDGTIS